MTRMVALPLLVVIGMAGCVRRAGQNSDCRWPGEESAKPLDVGWPPDRSQLRRDAEFAEDLAIRYADTHYGRRSGHFESEEAYMRSIRGCAQALFSEVAHAHGVTVEQVGRSLRSRPLGMDLALNLPFLVLYALFANMAVTRLLRRYPPKDGWPAAVIVAALCSLVLGIGGVLVGETWSLLAENLRVGNGHLSYRVGRLPWAQHRQGLFVFMLTLFWLIAWIRYRRMTRSRLSG